LTPAFSRIAGWLATLATLAILIEVVAVAQSARLAVNLPRIPDSAIALRPDSSVVERGPEKAGVGGSIPSLATTFPDN
jgi:hypothetical protein